MADLSPTTGETFYSGDWEGIQDIIRVLNISEGNARVAVHRLRKRFRDLFREEVAQTVASAEDIEEELRHLLSVLS